MSQIGNDVQQAGDTAAPTPSEVREQLERILASEDFQASIRLREFLSYVVESTLAGDADRIKGYTIATEVFGRGDDFDPQIDPIVRVEAGRLRRRLEHYYLSEGAGDSVLIDVPKGGYVATFSLRTPADSAGESIPASPAAPAADVTVRRRRFPWMGAAAALAVVVVGALGVWLLLPWYRPPTDPVGHSESAGGQIRAVVLPFEYATDTEVHPFLNDGLVEELIVTLAALPGFEVVALASAREAARNEATTTEIADSLDADLIIRGYVRQQRSDVRVTVTAEEAPGPLVRLSRLFEGSIEDVFELQEEISREIASAVGTATTPEFERRINATKELDPEVVALYYEAATLRDPPSDPVRSRLAEQAYRRVIELDPEFAGGYAGLAYVLAFRSWWRVGEHPEADADQALEAARQAVETDSDFGWAHMSLGLALVVSGDHDGAVSAASRATELSPNDPYVLTFAALVLAFGGDLDSAIPLARAAIRLDPLSVRTPYRNILGALLFQAGQYDESYEVLSENLALGGPDGPHTAYWRAGALAALGREEEARRELEKADSFPYEFDMRDFLRAFRDPEEAEKLFTILHRIGEPS